MSVEVRQNGQTEKMAMEEFERRVRDEQILGSAQIRIEVLTGDQFVPAHTLEVFQGLADPDIQAFRRALRTPGAPLVTAILVGVQIRFYLLSKVPGGSDFLLGHMPNWAPAILEQGQVHRLLTYGFLHLSLSHLMLNLFFLAYVGWNLERALGRWNLLCIFLVSVFSGGLLSMVLSPGRPSIGSSGGDFGLLAASVVFGWKHEFLIPRNARRYFGWAILPYLILSLALGFQSGTVDHWGHIGGLAGGWLMATLLEPQAWQKHRTANRNWRRTSLVCVLVAIGTVSWRGPTLVGLRTASDSGVTSSRPRSWEEEWTLTGDRGWTSRTRRATWVRHTGIHERPLSLEDSLEILLQLVDSGGTHPNVLRTQRRDVAGESGLEVTLGFELGGVPYVMEALLVPRGSYLHRFHLHTPVGWANRYRGLARRLFRRISFQIPPVLQRARSVASGDPRNWRLRLALANAAADAGHPEEAADAYRAALAMAGEQAHFAARGWLDLYTGYGVGMDTEDIARLASEHSDSVPVLLAAVDAYERAGLSEEALSLLVDATERFPNHYSVGRAWAVRGR